MDRRVKPQRRPLQSARGVLHDAAGADRDRVGARSRSGRCRHHRRPARERIRSAPSSPHRAMRVCVGITVLTGAPIHDALAVSRAVKAANPSMPIVWGGWHPSLLASECLDEPSVDIVVSGQGEDTFRNIVDRLIAGESVRGCESGDDEGPQRVSGARLLAHPGREILRAQGRAADRLHLVAGLPLSLRVLRRSRGLQARLDGTRARANRRRDRVPASALRG